MVCAASKVLVQSARSAPEAKFPQRLQKCQNSSTAAQMLKISKTAWLPRGPDPKSPFWKCKFAESSKVLNIFALSES